MQGFAGADPEIFQNGVWGTEVPSGFQG